MADYTNVEQHIEQVEEIAFALIFLKTQEEIDTLVPTVERKLLDDGVLWCAYPNGTSKKYQTTINRDRGWDLLGTLGFEAVRQVAIDEDWSALRFRKEQYIKAMSRRPDFAKTAAGKLRTKG